ncbi:MAG: TIGR02147 family protein [Bdellovibrionaceae bacterium]|nr:TIGR02147 family protein [Pseudobdellovibrionaceae bacterium]
MKTVFDFKNYQSFLLQYFQLKRGNQSRLSERLECQSSFLTQVIDQKVHLSLDQALKIPDFLGLNKNEKMAFLYLVQKEKASDLSSKKFFDENIEKLRNQNNRIKERIGETDELTEEAKYQYYSSWLYGAIHILCAFSWIRTIDDIVAALDVDLSTVSECVQFLNENQLITVKNGQLSIGKRQIHLSDDSKHIFSHHTSWRIRTIEKLSMQKKQKLNYSSLIGISKKDVDTIKEILLKSISDINQVMLTSGEEHAYIINIDLMDL